MLFIRKKVNSIIFVIYCKVYIFDGKENIEFYYIVFIIRLIDLFVCTFNRRNGYILFT